MATQWFVKVGDKHAGPFTSKQVKANAKKSLRLAKTKKWADFREFFEKKAEIENSISEINS